MAIWRFGVSVDWRFGRTDSGWIGYLAVWEFRLIGVSPVQLLATWRVGVSVDWRFGRSVAGLIDYLKLRLIGVSPVQCLAWLADQLLA